MRIIRTLGVALQILTFLFVAGCKDRPTPLSPEQIWTTASPSVVLVESTTLNKSKSAGTGFHVELGGQHVILTNRHVVTGAVDIMVTDTTGVRYACPSYKVSPDVDLAVIKVPENFPVPPLKAGYEVSPGQAVYVIGYPLGMQKTLTSGIVSTVLEDGVFGFDASIASGNSGGPLIDSKGQVIGVASIGGRPTKGLVVQNLNYAIFSGAIPDMRLFEDPVVAVHDLWVKIADQERALVEAMDAARLLPLDQLLNLPVWSAALSEPGANTPETEATLRELERELEGIILERRASIADAFEHSLAYLSKIDEHLKRQQVWFSKIASDPQALKFLEDERSFRLSDFTLKPEDATGLLAASHQHILARYRDQRFRLLAAKELAKRMNASDGVAKFVGQLIVSEGGKGAQRMLALGEAYPEPERLDTVQLVKYWLAANLPTFDPNAKDYLKTSDENRYYLDGSFLSRFLNTYELLALRELENNNSIGAVELARTQATLRGVPNTALLATCLIYAGKHQEAYDEFSAGLLREIQLSDPWTLKSAYSRIYFFANLGGDVGQVSQRYSEQQADNAKAWDAFLSSRASFLKKVFELRENGGGPSDLERLATEVLRSREFQRATFLDKAIFLNGVSGFVAEEKLRELAPEMERCSFFLTSGVGVKTKLVSDLATIGSIPP